MSDLITVLLFIYAGVYASAAGILLWSISGFRSGLRIAYILLLTGVMLGAIIHGIEAPAQQFHWTDQSWYIDAQRVAYTFGPLLIYLGARKFGRLLQIKAVSTSAWFAVLGGLLVAFIAGYILGDLHGIGHFEAGASTFFLWLQILAVWTLVQVWRQTSRIYQPSMHWLAWAIGLNVLGEVQFVVSEFLPQVFLQLTMTVSFLSGAIMLFKSALEFHKLHGKSLQELSTINKLEDSIDIITYIASLASNPRAIDPLLDEFRVLTASLDNGKQALNSAQQATLYKIYVSLEDYLTEKDAVRTYQRSVLREFIAKKLEESHSTSRTFWPFVKD
jgi:hypothetical protein